MLPSSAQDRSERDETEPGGLPTSEASVRARRVRNSGDERRKASPQGDRVSPPAKNHCAQELRPSEPVNGGRAESLSGASSRKKPARRTTTNARRVGAAKRGSSGSTNRGAPKTTSPPQVIAKRVDALTIAYRLEALPAIRDRLVSCREIAESCGASELLLRGTKFALKRTRKTNWFPFGNDDLYGVFDGQAPHGWQLEIVLYARYLATHELQQSIALADRIANSFGRVLESRVRRFDLAADLLGFPIEADIGTRLLTTRAGKKTHFAGAEGEAYVTFSTAAGTVTGISIGSKKSGISATIYDKTHHVNAPAYEREKALEYAIWNEAGWDGLQPVTRVEFCHQGSYLDEVQQRDPSTLENNLDGIWQRDVRWMRVVDLSTATRDIRCKLDPRWTAVTETVFKHPAEPIARSRGHRGGAKPAHVLGAIVSRMAATGALQVHLDQLAALPARAFETMSDEEAITWIDQVLEQLFRAVGADVFRDLQSRDRTPQETAKWLLEKLRGQAARFSSSDDEDNRK